MERGQKVNCRGTEDFLSESCETRQCQSTLVVGFSSSTECKRERERERERESEKGRRGGADRERVELSYVDSYVELETLVKFCILKK